MEGLNQKNKKKINKKKVEFKEKKGVHNSKNNDVEDSILNYESNFDPNSKRSYSYSCSINEENYKKFSGCEEIKSDINKKYFFLQTPKIKPKKGKLNPIPINIGFSTRKNSRFKPLNDDSIDKNIFNDIISEEEKDLSNKDNSYTSSDYYSDKEEVKENYEINNQENELYKIEDVDFNPMRLNSESKIYSLSGYKIKEENEDEFNEKGNLILKNMRRKMFQAKRSFLKNDKDYFNILNNNLDEKYKRYREDILMTGKEKKFDKLHNTISFTNHKNNGISILDFLRKKSSIDKTKKN